MIGNWRATNRRGGAIGAVILLIVVAVLFILLLNGYLSTDNPSHKPQAVVYIDEAGAAACGSNRRTVATNLTMWQVNHGGEQASVQLLRDMVNGLTCPRGGVFMMGKDGKIYCTLHDPPPAEEMKDMLVMNEPTPTPTPLPADSLPTTFTLPDQK